MLRTERRVKTIAALNISKLLISVICTIVWVVVLDWGVLGVLLGSLVGEVYGLIVLFITTRDLFRFRFNRETWRHMASYGLPFLPHHLQAEAINLFGQFEICRMLGAEQTGIYSVATKFGAPLAFVVGALQQAWTAYKFQIHATDDDPAGFFRTTVTYYMAGISYLWLGVAVWGPEMVRLMTQADYHPAAELVGVVALITVAQGMYFMMGTGLELSDNTRYAPLVSFTGLVTVVSASYLLIPTLHALGAAAATALGWLAMAAVFFYLAQQRYPIEYDWPALRAMAVLSAVCGATAYFDQTLSLAPRLVLGVVLSIVYPLLLILVLLRSPIERHRMCILWSRVSAIRLKRPFARSDSGRPEYRGAK
jgi:enterobacterial common antigen flippase